MNRSLHTIKTLSLLLLPILLLSACGSKPAATSETTPAPMATEASTNAGQTGTVLILSGPTGGRVLTMDQLKALPVTEGQGGIKSSTGKITVPEHFKGVALKDLVKSLGVTLDDTMGVTITAEDGYSMTFSYDQVMNGTFIAYDPAMGNELAEHDSLTAILAYEHNSQPLKANEEGILRLMVISAKNNQVVDGHWSIKWVNKVEIKPVGESWTLDMQGAISSPVTRDSYQSCGSPGCHGVSWEDENGQSWVGVPLWLLVGEVDDADSHSDVAYNRELADSGYSVDIVGGDGYTVTLDSQTIKLDNQILLAFQVNDGELPEKYYPLRLVGTGLEKNQMVGQVNQILVKLVPAPTPTVATVPENAGSLLINGLVNQEITFTDADLRDMEIVTLTAEGKDGPQDFQGVLLNALLDKSGIRDGAAQLVFTASDAYTAEVNLSDVRDCPKAMLAFMEIPGTYMIVLPEQPTSTWVKNIVQIEVD